MYNEINLKDVIKCNFFIDLDRHFTDKGKKSKATVNARLDSAVIA